MKIDEKMTEKVIITITIQNTEYEIPILVPVVRRGINEAELKRRASNIFYEFSINKIEVSNEEKK